MSFLTARDPPSTYCIKNGSTPRSPFCKRSDPQPVPFPCEPGEYAYTCPLGPLGPSAGTPANPAAGIPATPAIDRAGFGFEVVATLTDGNVASDCLEGQILQTTTVVTTMVGGTPTDNTLDTQARMFPRFDNPFGSAAESTLTLPTNGGTRDFLVVHETPPEKPLNPKFDPSDNPTDKWGADGYDTPTPIKRYFSEPAPGGSIRWVDVPSVGTIGRTNVNDRIRFVSYVGTAALGFCWCEFTVETTWNPTAGIGGPGLKIDRTSGLRCP